MRRPKHGLFVERHTERVQAIDHLLQTLDAPAPLFHEECGE